MESRRTASGPRHHTVATLGKLPGLDAAVHTEWESIDELLEGKAAPPATTTLGGQAGGGARRGPAAVAGGGRARGASRTGARVW